MGLSYDSHARDASLLEVLKESRVRDQIMGYSLRGVHKDELNMLLGNFPIKREGSQGQNKTYLVALKLAQFDFLKRTGTTVPLLLLDDIFDIHPGSSPSGGAVRGPQAQEDGHHRRDRRQGPLPR